MRKKILVAIICIFSVLCFCGCASINYSITIESTGIVTQAVTLKFKESDIVNSGKTLNNFIENVTNVSNQVVLNSYNKFLSSHQSDEELETYSGETVKFSEIVNYVNQNIEPNNGKAKIEWTRNGDTVYCKISLKFSTIYAYRYFNDSYPNSQDDDTVREDRVFYAKDTNYANSPFNDISNNTIAQYFMEYFNNQFDYSDISCSFTYSTPNSKIYSNADIIEEDENGNTIHTWNFTTEQITQNGKSKLELYTIKYRAYVWYLSAIAISLFVGLVLFVVCKIKEENDKKEKLPVFDNEIDYFNKTAQEIRDANKKD